MSEEVVRINFGLHFYQSVEVILKILGTPCTCLCEARVIVLVHAQIKVPVIDVCFPWRLGDVRGHVIV